MAAPQNVYDALKRMGADGDAWFTWQGERFHIVPVGEYDGQFTGIIKSGRAHGGIALAWVNGYKDGLRVYEGAKGFPGRGKPRRVQWDQVLAIVTERHPQRVKVSDPKLRKNR